MAQQNSWAKSGKEGPQRSSLLRTDHVPCVAWCSGTRGHELRHTSSIWGQKKSLSIGHAAYRGARTPCSTQGVHLRGGLGYLRVTRCCCPRCRAEWWASPSTGTATSTGLSGTASPFTSSMASTMTTVTSRQASTSGEGTPLPPQARSEGGGLGDATALGGQQKIQDCSPM